MSESASDAPQRTTSVDPSGAGDPSLDGPPTGFDFARVLRVAALTACVASAAFAAHGVIVTAQHLLRDIPAGPVTHVERVRAGDRLLIDGKHVRTLPFDVQLETGDPIEPRVGMQVSKPVGSLTYTIEAEPRGGMLWAIRQWLLPARVTLPLVIFVVLSWLLVFRSNQHARPLAVELLVLPIARWLAVLAVVTLTLALLSGCAAGCSALLFRMGG